MAKRDRKASGNDAKATAGDDTGIDVDVIEADEMRPSGKRRATERRSADGQAVPAKTGVTDVDDAAATRNPFVRIWTFLVQVVAELKKVIWPTRREMLVYSLGVLLFVALVTAVITGLDVGFAKLTLLVFG